MENNTFGSRLKALRLSKNLTQETFANIVCHTFFSLNEIFFILIKVQFLNMKKIKICQKINY